MTDPRAPIFAFLSPYLKPPGWGSRELLEGMDAHLDRLGVPRAATAARPTLGIVTPAEPVSTAGGAPAADTGRKLADPAKFFAAVRPMFGTLSDPQVKGIEAILKAAGEASFPLAWTAYALATAFHETGRKMAPNRENMNYSVAGLLGTFGRHRISEADARRLGRSGNRPADQQAIANIVYGGEWGRKNLGNTEPNDGWLFRGGGMDHCTGRANYGKVDAAQGLGGRLLADPDQILDPEIAAKALVSGLETGRYRGIKIADRIPAALPGTAATFTNARPIINPDRNGAKIAGEAMKFQAALVAGGWS